MSLYLETASDGRELVPGLAAAPVRRRWEELLDERIPGAPEQRLVFRNHIVLVLFQEQVRLVHHLARIMVDSEVRLGTLGLGEAGVAAEGAVELGGKRVVR